MSVPIRSLLPPALATTLVAIALVMLGDWQVERLAWKTDLIARASERPAGPVLGLPPPSQWPGLDVGPNEYRPFRMTGRFMHDKEALVFTSLSDARGPLGGPGYWVVTPLALEGGGSVLVNRGFAPQGRHLPKDRGEAPADGVLTVTGLLRPGETRGAFTPDDRPADGIYFARNVAAIAAAEGVPGPVATFTIDLVAAETPPGGLPQAGETRMVFANNHLGYAVTWYGLAAALLAVFASYVRTRLRERPDATRLTPPGRAP